MVGSFFSLLHLDVEMTILMIFLVKVVAIIGRERYLQNTTKRHILFLLLLIILVEYTDAIAVKEFLYEQFVSK